jgi:hypothetical protein
LTVWELVESQMSATDVAEFSTEGWTVTGAASENTVYSCGTLPMLGGYDVLGNAASITKSWTLGEHTNVKLVFELWKFGAWNGEQVFVEVDGTRVWSKPFGWSDAGTENFCNVPDTIYHQNKQTVNITLAHTAETIDVVISSTQTLHANQTAWGVRSFSL